MSIVSGHILNYVSSIIIKFACYRSKILVEFVGNHSSLEDKYPIHQKTRLYGLFTFASELINDLPVLLNITTTLGNFVFIVY